MKEIRENKRILNITMLILLASHISMVLFYFSLIQPRQDSGNFREKSSYIITSTSPINNVNSGTRENAFEAQSIISFTLQGSLSLLNKEGLIDGQRLFSYVVKIFRLSPIYIIHRVLII
ncbi:MAG TPA: hypothetical protein VHO90_15890 [Bacteroidales bacterium]|nr:hypothetical protein [Bacteroidales bacterium]